MKPQTLGETQLWAGGLGQDVVWPSPEGRWQPQQETPRADWQRPHPRQLEVTGPAKTFFAGFIQPSQSSWARRDRSHLPHVTDVETRARETIGPRAYSETQNEALKHGLLTPQASALPSKVC